MAEGKNLYKTKFTYTITLASIANNAGRLGSAIDNSTIGADEIEVAASIRSGTNAPTAGAAYLIYYYGRSNDATTDIADDGAPTSDTALSVKPANAQIIMQIPVTANANADFKRVRRYARLSEKFNIGFWNESGQTINASGSEIQVRGIIYQIA